MPRCWKARRSSILPKGFSFAASRVMGANRIELAGFAEAMRERLRAYGLFSEIISWKLRFFVPADAQWRRGSRQAVRDLSDRTGLRTGGGVMSRHDASDLASRLGQNAEAVCRHYLSNGRRQGNYWLVGDVRNTPGRSMFVRLRESRKGRAGKWLDAATGEHGDLLDVIREMLRPRPNSPMSPRKRGASSVCRIRTNEPRPRGDRRRAIRLNRSRAAAMGDVATDHRHNRGNVSAPTRITALHGTGQSALPSTLLLSARRAWPDADMAGDDRRRHRSCRAGSPARIAPGFRLTARARRRSTRSAKRWATCSATRCVSASPAKSWRPAKASKPCSPLKSALPGMADGGGALRSPSRRHPVPDLPYAGSISPATTIRRATGRGTA